MLFLNASTCGAQTLLMRTYSPIATILWAAAAQPILAHDSSIYGLETETVPTLPKQEMYRTKTTYLDTRVIYIYIRVKYTHVYGTYT